MTNVDELASTIVAGLGHEQLRGLLRQGILPLLARGRPVSMDDLGAQVGMAPADVDALLRSMPRVDFNDEGRLLGVGLTTRPTAHRFIIDGRTLYAWCALDTLMFAPILGVLARVESQCPATGRAVTLQVSPDGVSGLDPATAVASVVRPDGACITDVRSEFCDRGHFFVSAEAAAPWLHANHDGEVLAVADAFQLAQRINALL